MSQILYLHIGLHKTGTSAIQKFLMSNGQLLAAQGFLYPSLADGWENHNNLAWPFLDKKYDPKNYFNDIGEHSNDNWLKLVESIDSTPIGNIILRF